MQHPSFDSYWQAMQPYRNEYARINIPVLTMTGYYDDANAAAVNYLVQHTSTTRRQTTISSWAIPPRLIDSALVRPVVRAMRSIQLPDRQPRTDYQWFDYVMRVARDRSLLKDRINFE